MKLDEYDMNKVDKAKELLMEVYEYNYKPHTNPTNRLETIISKITELQELCRRDGRK